MNYPLGSRLQQTIRNIERRNVRGPVQAPVPVVHQSRIPKTAAYYLKKKQEATAANEPYLASVYSRAAKLAQAGKTREVNRLLYVANQTIQNKRNPPRPKRKPNKRYHLRNTRGDHQELYNVRNLKDYIVDYVQKVKHKKQLLYEFLRKEYDAKRKYNPSSRKFAQIKRKRRAIRA